MYIQAIQFEVTALEGGLDILMAQQLIAVQECFHVMMEERMTFEPTLVILALLQPQVHMHQLIVE